jgi:hypothetical protein
MELRGRSSFFIVNRILDTNELAFFDPSLHRHTVRVLSFDPWAEGLFSKWGPRPCDPEIPHAPPCGLTVRSLE